MEVMFREGETEGKEEGATAASSFAVAVNSAVTCGRRKRKRGDEVEEETEGFRWLKKEGGGVSAAAGTRRRRRRTKKPKAEGECNIVLLIL